MLEIRLARTPEEREQVFKLCYQIYVEELGWFENCENYEPNHEQKKVEEPLDVSANLFMAFHKNELAGTLRGNYAKNLDSDYYTKLYKMREKARDAHPLSTSITSRLMVQHDLRGTGIGLRMLVSSYNQQFLDGIKFDFIDWEANMILFLKN